MGEIIGLLIGEALRDLIFGAIDRSRTLSILAILASAGVCVAIASWQSGSLLGVVPVAVGVLVIGFVFVIARRVVANLPDSPAPPEPSVVAPSPGLEAPVAPANLEFSAAPAIAREWPRPRLWFHVLCALAGAGGQLFGFLLFTLFAAGSQADLGMQLICGSPFGLAAGLLISFILAPPAEIQKQDWRDNLPRWGRGPVVSFIVGVVIFLPVYFLLFIASAM